MPSVFNSSSYNKTVLTGTPLTLSGNISAAAVYVGNAQSIGGSKRIRTFNLNEAQPSYVHNQQFMNKYNIGPRI